MNILAAWTAHMQMLAHDSDIRAVVDVASIPGVLGTVAAVLRSNAGCQPPKLEQSLGGASLVLHSLIEQAYTDQGQTLSGDEIMQIVGRCLDALRAIYAHATGDDDANAKRAKVLETLVYERIAHAYGAGECEMDCMVSGVGDLYANLAQREFDVCAWNPTPVYGEAYECGVRPHRLTARDCDALLILYDAVQAEYAEVQPWFRIGLVSFESSKQVKHRMLLLAKSGGDETMYDSIDAFGWDNLDALRT